jgi:hypothetical protein
VSEGDAEMPDGSRRYDLDVQTTRSYVLHGVRDEAPRGVTVVSRVRRREDDDLQRRLANTTGNASASATNP